MHISKINQIPKLRNYTTHVKTKVKKSKIPNAGYGMFAAEDIPKHTVIGFYPGKVIHKSKITYPNYVKEKKNKKLVIEPNPRIRTGVHMINEAGKNEQANVLYKKLEYNQCVYFSIDNIKKGEELLTCYGAFYPRKYAIPPASKCKDPRCRNNKTFLHRFES